MWPKSKTTKGEAIDYYARVADDTRSSPDRAAADARPLPRRRRWPALLREAHPQGRARLGAIGAGWHGPRRRDRLRRLRRQAVARMARSDGRARASPVALEGGRDGVPHRDRLRSRPRSARRDARVLHGRDAGPRALPGHRARVLRQDVWLQGRPGLRSPERLRRRTRRRNRSPTPSPRRSRRPSPRSSSRA